MVGVIKLEDADLLIDDEIAWSKQKARGARLGLFRCSP
jgi:hypothetical protein